jgi:uncharacterized protein YuzE
MTSRLKRHRFDGHFTYDPEADAAYIYLDGTIRAGGATKTREVKGDRDVYLDFDKDGRLIGVEVLGLKRMPSKLAIASRRKFAGSA